jgi:hypothetical protein
MKEKLLSGWNFIRVLYLIAGVMMLVQSVADRQWLLALFGLYFAGMGLFAVGCAGGSCYAPPAARNSDNLDNTELEEIK